MMAIKDALLPEFDHEMGTTRRLLERVPEDKLDWQPHKKSMTLGRLATHVAEIPHWTQTIIKDSVFTMDGRPYEPKSIKSRTELLKLFDDTVAAARALVAQPEIIFGDEPSGNLDSRKADELLQFLRRAVDEFGQTIVMVTHDPRAAAYSDRVVFLADGKVIDEMESPTADRILDRMKALGG